VRPRHRVFGSIKIDRRLDPLRGEPRFEALARKVMSGAVPKHDESRLEDIFPPPRVNSCRDACASAYFSGSAFDTKRRYNSAARFALFMDQSPIQAIAFFLMAAK